jgi:tetratricopeptide (TPR) repeat protein
MCRLPRVYVSAVALLTVLCGCHSRQSPAAPVVAEKAANLSPVTLSVTEARTALAEAIRFSPADPAAQLELALFDARANFLADAEREMKACWRRFPRYARAPYQLGMLYLTHAREADAVTCLQAAAALSPSDAQVQWNAGLACFRAGDPQGAIRYLNSALAIDPQVPEPYLLLARCYDHQGTARLSLENVRLYLERSGDPAPGYYLMGRIYSRQADRDHAREWLQRAVQADPNSAEFWTALGRVYFELFNATHARDGIECYQKALALDPNNWAAHQYLGHALLDQHQYEAAVTHLRAALQNCPDPGPLYYDLSQALLKGGHEEEGRKTLATYQGYRDYQEGVNRLNRAIDAAPQDRARRYALARFCLAHHQPTAAQSVLEETARRLGVDPTLQRLQDEVNASHAPPATSLTEPSQSAAPVGTPGPGPSANSSAGAVTAPSTGADPMLQEGAPHGR